MYSTNLISSPQTNPSSRVRYTSCRKSRIDKCQTAFGISQTELAHKSWRLHERGCNLFQRIRNPLRSQNKPMELFLMEKVWPERNTDWAVAINQPVSAHRAAQLLEDCRSYRLICHEQVVVFSNRPLPQGILRCCCACVQEICQLIAKSKFHRLIEQEFPWEMDISPLGKRENPTFLGMHYNMAARGGSGSHPRWAHLFSYRNNCKVKRNRCTSAGHGSGYVHR